RRRAAELPRTSELGARQQPLPITVKPVGSRIRGGQGTSASVPFTTNSGSRSEIVRCGSTPETQYLRVCCISLATSSMISVDPNAVAGPISDTDVNEPVVLAQSQWVPASTHCVWLASSTMPEK